MIPAIQHDDLFEGDNLIEIGKAMGIHPDETQILFRYGFTRSEMEELLYNPKLLHNLAVPLLHTD